MPPFRIFTLADPFSDDVAYQETVAGSIYVEAPESERFVQAYSRLERSALDPGESRALISAVAKEAV